MFWSFLRDHRGSLKNLFTRSPIPSRVASFVVSSYFLLLQRAAIAKNAILPHCYRRKRQPPRPPPPSSLETASTPLLSPEFPTVALLRDDYVKECDQKPELCGVCKSWRSVALSNKTRFMASRPPMPIWIFEQAMEKEYSAEDFDGRQVKMHIPKSGGKTCVGLTCGYLVMFGRKPLEFWLMNPITRHGLRFPKVPSYFDPDPEEVRTILVFSPSIAAWVFVVLCRYTSKIWFSIAGKREWDYVSSTSDIIDLLDFNGKIYAIDDDSCLYGLRLDPKPKLMLLKTKNILESDSDFLQLVSSGENIYAVECLSFDNQVHKLDLDEMLWVSPEEKTLDE
ncbi:unnamed protein product [Lactuca virosa]|uniref:KIB1-4 beta-propeller domain-containing protein n=1 Tax=Lactuca virosa TaxID=75947 RepID=A0AAU9NPG1_9ASTR|nr:unnamed protein product [Lactuca virosa]